MATRSEMTESPFFCKTAWVNENEDAFALRDKFPVSPGHTLIVPKRLVASVFDLTESELSACWRLLQLERTRLLAEYAPVGFNVGINDGEAAGQTIFHAHIHLIPRYKGDHTNPRGGVRGVIPDKADY